MGGALKYLWKIILFTLAKSGGFNRNV